MNPPDFSQFNQPNQPGQPVAPSPEPPQQADHKLPKASDSHQSRNPLEVMQPGEQVVCEVKRHPIGIFAIYVAAGFLLTILAILAFVVTPSLASDDSTQVMTISAVGFTIITVFTILFVFVSNYVYWGNTWVVTSDSLTQVTQTSLFSRQSSQLSLGNLEDVTSEKNGILAQMLNFGVLKAETAGERSKFVFLYCPNPDYYAQKILAAREQFELAHHGGKQEPYQPPEGAQPASPGDYPVNPLPQDSQPQPQPLAAPQAPVAFEPPPPISQAPAAEPPLPPNFPTEPQSPPTDNNSPLPY